MSRKGMAMTLKILVIVVVILIAALLILSVFAGGIGNVSAKLNEWITGVPTGGVGCIATGAECTQIWNSCCAVKAKCTQGEGANAKVTCVVS